MRETESDEGERGSKSGKKRGCERRGAGCEREWDRGRWGGESERDREDWEQGKSRMQVHYPDIDYFL